MLSSEKNMGYFWYEMKKIKYNFFIFFSQHTAVKNAKFNSQNLHCAHILQ